RQPAAGLERQRLAAGDGFGVPVDGDDLGALCNDRATVAAGAEGAVDEDATGSGRQKTQHLIEEHRNMADRSASATAERGGAAPPGRGTKGGRGPAMITLPSHWRPPRGGPEPDQCVLPATGPSPRSDKRRSGPAPRSGI